MQNNRDKHVTSDLRYTLFPRMYNIITVVCVCATTSGCSSCPESNRPIRTVIHMHSAQVLGMYITLGHRLWRHKI